MVTCGTSIPDEGQHVFVIWQACDVNFCLCRNLRFQSRLTSPEHRQEAGCPEWILPEVNEGRLNEEVRADERPIDVYDQWS